MEQGRILSLPDEAVLNKIHVIGGQNVLLDSDLADFSGVTTENMNKAVLRNTARFPEDFMFQLTKEEFENLLFQIGISSWAGRRTPPRAFTEDHNHSACIASAVHIQDA